MAGGRGTRFWPLSRLKRPKQLLPLGTTSSLLRDTFERVAPVVGPERILVITNREQAAGVEAELPELPADRIIAEPVGRNTAACSVLGVKLAARLAPGAPVALLPADHLIDDPDTFRRQLAAAFTLAREKGGVVTFGVPAAGPHTGYGYLERRDGPDADWYEGLRFIEKPDPADAETFFRSGRHFWNSGIFVWNGEDFGRAAAEHLPDLDRLLADAADDYATPEFPAHLERAYPQCPSVSIDVGVMEKLDAFKVIPAGFGWSDLGSWDAWGESAPELVGDNRGRAVLTSLDSARNIVHAPDGVVALLGVENLIVVRTGDALLIADRSRVQDIRALTAQLETNGQQDLL